jgi:nitrile hydratase accessory protein
MTAADERGAEHEVAHMGGRAALPRRNGALVFDAPWESRAFGLAVALHQQGLFAWEEFQTRLIAEIEGWESVHGPQDGEGWRYYERWLDALQGVLDEKQLVTAEQLGERTAQLVREDREQRHEPH